MIGLRTHAAVLADFPVQTGRVPAHLATERHWRAVGRRGSPVPSTPTAGDLHVQFTCGGCGDRSHVLIEGGARAGDQIEAGCEHCGTANDTRIRTAMFA